METMSHRDVCQDSFSHHVNQRHVHFVLVFFATGNPFNGKMKPASSSSTGCIVNNAGLRLELVLFHGLTGYTSQMKKLCNSTMHFRDYRHLRR
jgi:hypothetical protein